MVEVVELSPSCPMQVSSDRQSLFWASPLAWPNFLRATLWSEAFHNLSCFLPDFCLMVPELNHVQRLSLPSSNFPFYDSDSVLVPVFWRTHTLSLSHIRAHIDLNKNWKILKKTHNEFRHKMEPTKR